MHGVEPEDFGIITSVLENIKLSNYTALLIGHCSEGEEEARPDRWLIYKNETWDKEGDACHDGGALAILSFFQKEAPTEEKITRELERKDRAFLEYKEAKEWAMSEAERLRSILPRALTARAICERVEIEPVGFNTLRHILNALDLNPYHGFGFKKGSSEEKLFWEKFLPLAKQFLPDKKVIDPPKRFQK